MALMSVARRLLNTAWQEKGLGYSAAEANQTIS
jgi:hypothetical protein